MNRLLLSALAASLLFFFIDFGDGDGGALSQLYGFAHLGFFMATAAVVSNFAVVARRPLRPQFFIIMGIVLSVGGLIEVVQPFFGRSGSWRDLGIDLLGGFAGMVFLSPARCRLPRGAATGGRAIVIVIGVLLFYSPLVTLWDMGQAVRQFPVLSDFETAFEKGRWSSGSIVKGPARHGEFSLKVPLTTDTYSGTTLLRSFGDWRGYSAFAFSIYNPDPEPLTLTVSIRDREHFRRGGEYRDRFNRSYVIAPGWNDVLIPVADIKNAPSGRRMELDRLSEVVVFTVELPFPRLMYLDWVRVVR